MIESMKFYVCLLSVLLMNAVVAQGFGSNSQGLRRCACCSATMGLRVVEGRAYCTEHYCVKHKVVKSYRDCTECVMERQLKSGKAKCQFCTSKKKLLIKRVDRENNSYEYQYMICSVRGEPVIFVCPQHYCKTHKLPFTKKGEKIVCAKCSQIESRRASDEFWSEKLDGIFGRRLGVQVEGGDVGEGFQAREFVPEKAFRSGYKYWICTNRGKVFDIKAEKEGLDFSEAEAEFNEVVRLLDIKYSQKRRFGDRGDEYDKKMYMYIFDSVLHNPKDAKQVIFVTLEKMDKRFKYRVSIAADLMDEMDAVVDEIRESDLDAL